MTVMFCMKLAWLRDKPNGDPLDRTAVVAVNTQLNNVVDQGNGWLSVQTTTIDAQKRSGFIPSDCATATQPGSDPAPQGLQIDFNSHRIPAGRSDMARLIASRFALAGFGFPQQVAAIANAIGESALNPSAHATVGENSVGLFQCNIQGGLGVGHSVEFLMDPDNNIGIVIAEAKKFASFVNATAVPVAVAEFVRNVERPRSPATEIQTRTAIASDLVTPATAGGGSQAAAKFMPDLVFGDSIGDGLRHNSGRNIDGVTKVGIGPDKVMTAITNFLSFDTLVGKNVVLSSGLSNNPVEAGLGIVRNQIDLLLENKANVDLLGVGTNFDAFNPQLREIAAEKSVRFTMLTANDGVHPKSYSDLLKAVEGTGLIGV